MESDVFIKFVILIIWVISLDIFNFFLCYIIISNIYKIYKGSCVTLKLFDILFCMPLNQQLYLKHFLLSVYTLSVIYLHTFRKYLNQMLYHALKFNTVSIHLNLKVDPQIFSYIFNY